MSWCRGVAPLTSERHRLARGRPQAPAGEPRRRCCTSTAPPGAPTTSIGVLVQQWAPIVDATTRRFRRATIDPEQAGSRAATCPRPARGAARRAEEGWHTRRHLWTADWYQPAAVAAKGGSERRVIGRVVPGAGGEAGLQPGRTAGGVSRRARCVARSGPPPPNACTSSGLPEAMVMSRRVADGFSRAGGPCCTPHAHRRPDRPTLNFGPSAHRSMAFRVA